MTHCGIIASSSQSDQHVSPCSKATASWLRLHPQRSAAAGHYLCLGTVGTTQVQVNLKEQDPRQFTYDQVLEENTTQEKVFEGKHM